MRIIPASFQLRRERPREAHSEHRDDSTYHTRGHAAQPVLPPQRSNRAHLVVASSGFVFDSLTYLEPKHEVGALFTILSSTFLNSH